MAVNAVRTTGWIEPREAGDVGEEATESAGGVKKLARLQERDGFTVFHVKDFKAKVGEFRGWSDGKCAQLVDDLTAFIRDNLTEGMVVFLEHDRYLNEYRAPPIPKKMSLDSQYGVCFRACLGRLINVLTTRNYRDRLHVVIEDGHRNVGDCQRIFYDLKARFYRAGADFLGTFTVDSKISCPPLMMSDFLAGTYSMMRKAETQSASAYGDIAPSPGKKEAALVFLELVPDALRGLKDGFEEMRQQDIAEWRARQTRRRTS